jgi:DMSO/TMAO reductase YedYZ heme-binding membrane subunit
MGIGASLFLIAVGAICYWALDFDIAGIDIDAIGVILMVIGALGLVLSLLFWSSFSPMRRRETVVHDRDVVRERDVI